MPGGFVLGLSLALALGFGPEGLLVLSQDRSVFSSAGSLQFAARLAKAFGGGRAYRYGGEEFTLLFPGKTLREVLPHLKEARRSVEEAVFTLRSWRRPRKIPVDPGAWRGARKQGPKRLSVTVSIGVADSTGKDPSPEAVLKKADQALYRAKKAGRNRVVK